MCGGPRAGLTVARCGESRLQNNLPPRVKTVCPFRIRLSKTKFTLLCREMHAVLQHPPRSCEGIDGARTVQVPLSSLQLQGPIQPESPTSAAAGPFGASAAPASTGSLLGDMTAVPAGSQGGGTAAAPASSLFGAPPVVSTSSLFGATAAPPASGGALFGATTAQSASSLFGAATGASTSSLFGTATATSASSLFGGAAPAPGGSLFGAAPAVSTGGMFGAAPPTSTGGLFGSTAAVPASSAFGSAAAAPTLPVSSAAGLSAFPGSFGASAGPPATPASAAPATHPKDIPSPESPCLSCKNSSGTSPLCDPAVAPPVFGAAAPFAQPQTSTLAQPLFPDAAGASAPRDPSTGPLHLPTPSTLGPAFVPEIEHEHVGALSGPGPAEIPATAAAPAAAESDSGSHDPGFPDTTIAPLSSRSPSWGHRAAAPRGPGSSGPSPLSSEDAVDAGGSAADEDSADGDDSVDEVLSPAPEVGALVLKGAVSPDPGLVQLLEDKLKMLPTPDGAVQPPCASPVRKRCAQMPPMTRTITCWECHLESVLFHNGRASISCWELLKVAVVRWDAILRTIVATPPWSLSSIPTREGSSGETK